MKIDRLINIIFSLLNSEILSGEYFAQKYEVSKRTIQRDIDTINMAGIPIVSIKGSNGGYKILDTYKLYASPLNQENIETIIMSLQSVQTATQNESIDIVLNKILPLQQRKKGIMNFDFSIAKENESNTKYIHDIVEANKNKNKINLSYMNSNGYCTVREVEPVCVNFKWYNWYFVAWCTQKQNYRIFKLNRIKNLKILGSQYTNTHVASKELFDSLIENDAREYYHIKIQLINQNLRHILDEYLPNGQYIQENDKLFYEIDLPKEENFWYGIILSLAENIKIIQPKSLIDRIIDNANKIRNLYNDDM